MYYKAWHLDVSPGKVRTDAHPLYCCYAESDDGIHWRKPELGLFEFRGSKANNIVIASGHVGPLQVDAGHPAVFKDENPDAPAEARYKAFVRSDEAERAAPVQVARRPALVADERRPGHHRRGRSTRRTSPSGTRSAASTGPTGGSSPSVGNGPEHPRDPHRDLARLPPLGRPGRPDLCRLAPEELYTNQVKPYHRAPHLLIGFPTRYIDRGWSPSMKALPEREHRETARGGDPRYGTAVTEGLLMASRDGVRFHRWNEAFLRPGIEREGTWNYGQQYIAWHLVETKSDLDGAPPTSSRSTPARATGPGTSSAAPPLHPPPRRVRLRQRPMSGGELVTRPLTFDGAIACG